MELENKIRLKGKKNKVKSNNLLEAIRYLFIKINGNQQVDNDVTTWETTVAMCVLKTD